MHLLTTTSASLDEIAEPVDLRQQPSEIAALSFSDSDLSGLAAAGTRAAWLLPSLGFTALRDLRHPMSIDLWLEHTAADAKVVLVRILGGYDWWRYGCDRLAALARQKDIALAMLPGECREHDERLAELSTVPRETLDALLAYFREGGPDNMDGVVATLAGLAGADIVAEPARPMPKAGLHAWPGARSRNLPSDAPIVPILFYRSMLLAGDVAPIDQLCDALADEGLVPLPVYVASLKEPQSAAFVRKVLADVPPAAIVTATAFAAGAEPGTPEIFAGIAAPLFQVVTATTRRAAWQESPRGLAPADLAMHVVLPEIDGRVLAGAISFKEAIGEQASGPALNRPEPDRIRQVTARIAATVRLARTPPAKRRLVIIMPDYPAAAGRTGYAVGLDVPNSVLAMLEDLRNAGYAVDGIPRSPRELLDLLDRRDHGLPVSDYARHFAELPAASRNVVEAAWGALTLPHVERVAAQQRGGRPNPALSAPPSGLPTISPSRGEIDLVATTSHSANSQIEAETAEHVISPLEGEMVGRPEGGEEASQKTYAFRAATFGNVTVALAPDRGRSADRRADYHDPTLPPHHALLAFGFWLRHELGAQAIVHAGAHGTLEWLPGKTVALTGQCFPEIVAGPLPVVYPFIVSNPGEAAQAKRRIAAITIGHLPPPLATSSGDPNREKLERLVDEYAQADGLDRRRRDRLAALIVETARETALAAEAGVATTDAPDEALRRIDAWLCDLKDFAVKDGLHIFGRASEGESDPLRLVSAAAERDALLAALAGHHVASGPSGAPARGRADVLPTGRNLFTADPRTMPTPTAFDLGKAAAEEVLRRYLQEHGDWPRSLVIDLWGSASLRTGGEEIAQGLHLMGCRPQWDPATGRVTGVEVLPQARLARPRIDVTWRVSGLFRDMFATQIALLDAAVAAVAATGEDEADNPLVGAAAREGRSPARIFGSSPGTYGSGVEDLLSSGHWDGRDEVGHAYLAATSHAYGGEYGDGVARPGAFAERVAGADMLVHTGDDPGRDILEGSADVAFVGGFAAAVAALGGKADLVILDTTDPARPKPRSVTEAVTRVVRARATNARFIAGQMRHGPRGASEFAETVDRLVAFAETTDAIPGRLIEAVHDAYVADPEVRAFLLRENPAAAASIAERLASARRRGLWHPLRNSVDDDLASLIAEARAGVAA